MSSFFSGIFYLYLNWALHSSFWSPWVQRTPISSKVKLTLRQSLASTGVTFCLLLFPSKDIIFAFTVTIF